MDIARSIFKFIPLNIFLFKFKLIKIVNGHNLVRTKCLE